MPLSAREAVLKLLNDTDRKALQSGNCVERLNTDFGLDYKDSALAVNIYLGCIQFRNKIDYYINSCSESSPGKIDIEVRNMLRMAVYQMLWLDRVPDHAAVNEAVKLCKKYNPRAVSFVNAVLRRISSAKSSLPAVCGDTAERFAVEYSAERWFVEYLIGRFGEKSAEKFLDESNKPAPLSLRINSIRISAEEYKQLLNNSEIPYSEHVLEDLIFTEAREVRKLPGFSEGFFFIQDPAAAMCIVIGGAKPGMRVLDACSSPGGKAFSAAINMNNTGSILACDINGSKVERVREGAKRLGLDIISCSVQDAKCYNKELDSVFDLVIADVPCSGFGVIRKKPEIKYKTRDEIAALPDIQKSMIDNLSRYVRPGGTLLYSTCTILREENEDVVEAFLSEHSEFQADNFNCCGITGVEGMYTFLPHIDGTDGFFAAKMTRVT